MKNTAPALFKVLKGPRLSDKGAPVQKITDHLITNSVALLGDDFPQMKPKFTVKLGSQVLEGQTIFSDRKHPEVCFVTPLSGTIDAIEYGPRRTLSSIVIRRDDTVETDVSVTHDGLSDASGAEVRTSLQTAGMWPAFLARPFGRIPTPDATPSAIFINAFPSSPLAPAPHVVLANQSDDFCRGVYLLKQLTDGIVHICQRPGELFFPPNSLDVKTSFFRGAYAAGLAGTHINRLHLGGPKLPVWTIGYQDVIAIGHLFNTGQYMADRVISLAGSALANPRLIRTPLGANISDIINIEDKVSNKESLTHTLSGNALTGRKSSYLGLYHQEITTQFNEPASLFSRWLSKLPSPSTGLLATNALERALALNILPVPLMRALSVGDSEAALKLGCLELVEGDVAGLTEHCTSGANYGHLLRQVLDELAEDMV